MKEKIKNYFNKDRIFIFVCVLLIAFITFLVVFFQHLDIEKMDNKTANVSIVHDEKNLNSSLIDFGVIDSNESFLSIVLDSNNYNVHPFYALNSYFGYDNTYAMRVSVFRYDLNSLKNIVSSLNLDTNSYIYLDVYCGLYIDYQYVNNPLLSYNYFIEDYNASSKFEDSSILLSFLNSYDLDDGYWLDNTLPLSYNFDFFNDGASDSQSFHFYAPIPINSFINSNLDSFYFVYSSYCVNNTTDVEFDISDVYGYDFLSYNPNTLLNDYNNYVSTHSYTNEQYIESFNNGYNNGYQDGLDASSTPVFSSLWSNASYEYGSTRGSSPYVSGNLSDLVITTNTLDFRQVFNYISNQYESSWLDYGNSFDSYFKIIFDDSNPIFLNEVLSCNFVSNHSLSTYYVNVTLNTNQTVSFSFNYNNGWFLTTNDTFSKDMIMKSIVFVGGQPYDSSSVYDDAIFYFNYDLYGSAFSSGFNEGSLNSQNTINELNEQINSLSEAYSNSQNTINELNEQINSLNTTIDGLNQNIRDLQFSLNQANEQAQNTLDNLTYSMISAIMSTPFNILHDYLNWNFFGINLFSLFTSLITLLLLLWVIKFLLGRK